jgi:hypothetical protein
MAAQEGSEHETPAAKPDKVALEKAKADVKAALTRAKAEERARLKAEKALTKAQAALAAAQAEVEQERQARQKAEQAMTEAEQVLTEAGSGTRVKAENIALPQIASGGRGGRAAGLFRRPADG